MKLPLVPPGDYRKGRSNDEPLGRKALGLLIIMILINLFLVYLLIKGDQFLKALMKSYGTYIMENCNNVNPK